jgi:hypothetical protein
MSSKKEINNDCKTVMMINQSDTEATKVWNVETARLFTKMQHKGYTKFGTAPFDRKL